MSITDKQKKEIRGYIEKWRPKLFLHQWFFDLYYHNEPDRRGLLITMQPEYKNATIEINIDDYYQMDKPSREEVIVHELCHAVLQPMVEVACQAAMCRQVSQQEIDYHKESVTQHFARSIFYLNK